MSKVYIASPYTIGSKERNVMKQISVFHILAAHGHVPFAPLLGHYVDLVYPFSYDFWLKWGLEWMKTCDCVLRLAGESPGADKEVAEAEKLGIPVYYSIGELLKNEIGS